MIVASSQRGFSRIRCQTLSFGHPPVQRAWDLFQSPKNYSGGSTEEGAVSAAMSWSWIGADKLVIGGVSIIP